MASMSFAEAGRSHGLDHKRAQGDSPPPSFDNSFSHSRNNSKSNDAPPIKSKNAGDNENIVLHTHRQESQFIQATSFPVCGSDDH